jgi:hypothetical protein
MARSDNSCWATSEVPLHFLVRRCGVCWSLGVEKFWREEMMRCIDPEGERMNPNHGVTALGLPPGSPRARHYTKLVHEK